MKVHCCTTALLATALLIAASTASRAEESAADPFGGQVSRPESMTQLEQRAVDAQASDPTAPTSIRSHGRP